MKKITTALFGFALAGIVLLGAGCGSYTAQDLEGKWSIDSSGQEGDTAEALQGATVEFVDNKMIMSVEFAGQTATMEGAYTDAEVGTEEDQSQADFAIQFSEFKMKAGEEEEALNGADAPFQTVHVKFGEDKNHVTLYEKKLNDSDAAKLVRKEE